MLLDSFRFALRSLWANKMRSFLTLLGVIIGIYAVVALLSIARGVQKQTTDLVDGFGPTMIMVLPGEQIEGQQINMASQFAPSTIFVDDVEYLDEKADLLDPSGTNYAVFVGGVLRKGEKKSAGFTVGATTGFKELFKADIVSGRNVTQEDLDTKARVIFLDKKVRETLGADLGDKIFLGQYELEVAGTFEIKNASIMDQGTNNLAIIPATLASEINQSKQVNRVIVKAKDADSVDAAKEQVQALLKEKHGATDFTVMLPSDMLDMFNEITNIMTYLIVGIASISLLVGGIGISNIMLVTVTERTREIGIRKAVGATEWAIMSQFLIESVLLTVFGAAIGVGLAALVNFFLAKFSPLEPVLTWGTLGLALGMGVLTGVIFGLFPAWRAARKNPVVALRFE